MTTMTRKPVPLDERELAALSDARTEGTPLHTALTALAGPDALRSEASTLQTLVRLGLDAAQEEVLQSGYAAYAASLNDEDRQFRAASRARRRDREPRA